MTDAIAISIAVGSPEQAQTIAEALISRRLAACIQQHGIVSTYRWEGAVERSEEIMLTVKTRAGLFAAVEEAVLALHDYEVPEIVAAPIIAGHGPYLDWVGVETE